MRQSLRIIEQCVGQHAGRALQVRPPAGDPPLKERTMHDIETLIHHFLSVSWGPVMPPGEAAVPVEATKGSNSYYLISDGGTMPYRTRIRTPSFAHIQMMPHDEPGADDAGPDRRCWAASTSCWPTWTAEPRDEKTDSMLTEQEKRRDPTPSCADYDQRRGASHRGAARSCSATGAGSPRRRIRDVADFLDMTSDELDSVATFYNLIYRQPVGRHVILLCDSVSCWIMGYDPLLRAPAGAPGHRPGRDDGRTAASRCCRWRAWAPATGRP